MDMWSKSPYFLILSYFLASSITTKYVRGETIAKVDPKFEPVCSIYLAESTIPNAGMGMFTSQAIQEGAEISSTGDGPIIVIHNILQNMGTKTPVGLGHMDYLWHAAIPEDYESAVDQIAMSTVGALANYHPVLINVRNSIGSFDYDDSIVDRNTDIGAGAFSYHRSRNLTARRDISAGEELFDNYGEEWMEEPMRFKMYKNVARKSNYETVARIVRRFRSDNLDDASLSVVQEIVDIYDKRTASLLPKTRLVNESILKATDIESIVINLGKASLQQRSADWLVQNGRCMDNLVPRISTLPQAGNGAFAQRFLPEGSLVVPAPTLQTMDAKYLNIRNRDGMVNNRQMLLNYCIAHEDSTMLLCPISRAILMNHCSDRMTFGGECDEGVGANAKLEFDDNFDVTSKVWQQKSFNEIKKEVHAGRRGLSFNVIATRDIQPGEEVFIDYGDAWEEAWKEHLRSWQPPSKHSKYSSYMSVTKLTKNHDIRTTVELAKNPYADNVVVKCLFAENDDNPLLLPPSNWRDMSDAALIQKYSHPGGIYSISSKEFISRDYFWRYDLCNIYFHGDDDRLTVGIYAISNDIPLIFTDYPSESVRFVSKEFTSDEHLPNSFRHPIGLQDKAMFPEQWKNLKSE